VETRFTQHQERAIHTDHADLCVAAGAGSGKTGVLVHRFVRLIAESKRRHASGFSDLGIDQILVITFTDKATREMKTRIVEELSRRGLAEERRQVETAYISTIHGFCSRLLQENPFEAGVDPQFRVLDEPQARRLLRQVLEAVIATAYDTGETEVTELIAAVQSARREQDDAGDPLVAVANAVERSLNQLRGAGRTLAEVERHWRSGLDHTAAHSLAPAWAIVNPVITEVAACVTGISALRAGAQGAFRIASDAVIERAACLVEPVPALPDILAVLEAIQKSVARVPASPTGPPKEIPLAQWFQRLKIACEEASTLYGAVTDLDERASRHCHRLIGLTVTVWQAYQEAKRTRGLLDSDDLQAEAVRLLEIAPSVRNRYRKRFRHLMIDEFQDTNALQMRLIELLHVPEPLSSPSIPTNRLFVVGDVQQSIYAFRNADPGLFRDVERRFREEGAGVHVPLAINFRSRPEILALVGTVFRQVWRNEPTPFVALEAGATFDPRNTPSLELLLSQDLMRRDYVRLEADALAARIQRMVENEELRLTAERDPRRGQPVSYRDVAILLRSLTDVQQYEEAFARRGVPCFVVGGGRGYYARSEIRDLLNVLTLLDTPLDDVALVAALRSPFVGADVDTIYRLALQSRSHNDSGTDTNTSASMPLYPSLAPLIASGALPPQEEAALAQFLETLEGVRAQEDRLPVGHLLERLIARSHYDARLLCRPGGRRRLANVRKLLQIANADPVMGVRDFIRRLRELEKLSDREGDAPTEEEASDVVRIMTIHGAKGLEFPVVILADLARGLLIPERGLFTCDPVHLAFGTRIDGQPSLIYRLTDNKRQQADRKEAERLLYVGMTRAREYLILCGNVGRNRGFNWADNLFQLLGQSDAPPEPETRTLTGGLQARVASLAHYAHRDPTSLSGAVPTPRRALAERINQIANAIADAPLSSDRKSVTPYGP
jgi:ATP-dependent helicase/nuclease subunit A